MTFILTWHRGCYRLKSRARCFHALIPREWPLSLCITTSLFAQDVWWFGASEVCEKRASKDMLEQCPIPSHAVGLSSSKCEAGGIAHMSQSLCSGCSSAYPLYFSCRICRSRRRFRECVLTWRIRYDPIFLQATFSACILSLCLYGPEVIIVTVHHSNIGVRTKFLYSHGRLLITWPLFDKLKTNSPLPSGKPAQGLRVRLTGSPNSSEVSIFLYV